MDKEIAGTSLVVHWVRLHAPVQGVWVQSLVRELDPAHVLQLRSPQASTKSPHAATKDPTCHNKDPACRN